MVQVKVVAQYADMDPNPMLDRMVAPPSAVDPDAVTIGEALEASAISSADKPIDLSDAAAIQAAEMRATGSNKIPQGGLGAEAQSAAARNAHLMRGELKTTIGDILMVRSLILPILLISYKVKLWIAYLAPKALFSPPQKKR